MMNANAGRCYILYVVVDYALEKNEKNIVSDLDQLQHAEEAGVGSIRATDSGRGRLRNVCDPLMCVISLAALGACCTRSRTPSTLVT